MSASSLIANAAPIAPIDPAPKESKATASAARRKAAGIALIEQQIGVESLVDSLFWIPTRLIKNSIPLDATPIPEEGSYEVAYVNITVRTPPEQIEVSPPMVRFLGEAQFRATSRKNSAVSKHPLGIYIYGRLADLKALTRIYMGDKVVLKGFLRRGLPHITPFIELHGAEPVTREDLLEFDVSYSAKGNAAPKNLHKAIYNALSMCVPQAAKQLREAIELADNDKLVSVLNLGLDDIEFSSLEAFFWALHLPESEEHHDAARQAARNLGCAEIVRRAARASHQPENPASIIPLDRDKANELVKSMGITPTKDQVAAMREIYADMASNRAMRRLLSGDVGTGKTVVFGILAAAAQQLCKSVAIYIPNGILASQVATEFRRWWPHVPVNLVTSSKKPTAADLQKNPILIGTSAILNFWEAQGLPLPHLLIVDEQQKSSRDQRERLLGGHTNFLECTATCLPRTMGLVEHGALNISIVREQPVKKKIISKIIKPDDKKAVFAEIRDLLAKGARCAVVLPEVEAKVTGDHDTDEESEKKAVTTAVVIWNRIFPGKVIGLHGRMKESEKIEALEKVKRGDFPIVLATSLIEIGVTIPDLRLVLIVNPEIHGATTLHQLRGRLVRNGGVGSFYLLVENDLKPKALERLNVVCSTNDGFELAMADFEMRGFGDLAMDSSEQSGQPICIFKNIRIRPTDVQRVVSHLKVGADAGAGF